MAGEPSPSTVEARDDTARAKAGPWRPRLSLRALLLLPVLAAVLLAALVAVDRWTAAPWDGPKGGGPVVFRLVDAATGRSVTGATVTMYDRGVERFTMPTSTGRIRNFGGDRRATGYRSLLRDTRRLDVGAIRIRVIAPGYEDFEADGPEISRDARPSEDETRVEYIVRLRRR